MKIKTLTIAVAATLGLATLSCSKEMRQNPFLQEYTTVYEIPPFDLITEADYLPALQEGIAIHSQEVSAICNNPETPTFENTIIALENSGEVMGKVLYVFNAVSESNSTEGLTKLADELYTLYSQHSDQVSMNDTLFQRVKHLYDNLDSLNLEAYQRRAVEKYYKSFTRNGALLSAEDKAKLSEVNSQLVTLYNKFNKNLLDATNAFTIVVEDSLRLAGLPQNLVASAAELAKSKGQEGKWMFTLQAPMRLPVLQFADDRELRREMYEGYTSLATAGEFNNYPVINDILKARAQKAAILGFENFGSYMTDNVMAKTIKNAEDLLMQIWKPAVKQVAKEVAEMQAIADREGKGVKIAPYDYYYYAEKVRKEKYALDENQVREYFPVNSVVDGIFTMAERLYGVKFVEMPDAPKYFDEVTVYDVVDAQTNEHVAVFMTDYFARPSKRQGAWMSVFKESWIDAQGDSRPVVYNVGNFTAPVGDTPSLLTLDEVETAFHEFGHGLHGMLTRTVLKSQSGTNTDRDFVELPSQIHEHWAFHPEMLRLYAKHYNTGEVIPDELIAKLQAASTHNQGFATAELAGAALLDLQFGKLNPEGDVDVEAFEAQVTKQLGVPAQLTYRYRPTYFKHIFGSDGYASGYYTYLWAEVLDTHGFDLFEQKGIFDPETAKSFKENVLEKGDSEDPMVLYKNFRGEDPNVEPLLRNRGLK